MLFGNMYVSLTRIPACTSSKRRCLVFVWIVAITMFVIFNNFESFFQKSKLHNSSKIQNASWQLLEIMNNTRSIHAPDAKTSVGVRLQPGKVTEVNIQESQKFSNNSLDLVYYVDKLKPIELTTESPDKMYQDRREMMLQVCADRSNNFVGNYGDAHVKSRFLVDQKQNLGYCYIEKIASTFWKRLYRIVIGESRAVSPLDQRAHGKLKNLNDIPEINVTHFMDRSTTFLFVRDPYTRLLSGYVDKLFSPNTLFWNGIGKYAIRLFRKNASSVALKCGHDLSFREFVKYIIHTETNNVKRNEHFTPAYDHCKPCQYKYDIIGKFETFKDDTLYILDKIGKPELRQELEQNFRESQLKETIFNQVYWLFRMRSGYKGCVSFYDAQRRMWKKLQIRGILSKMSKYPVELLDSDDITKNKYSDDALRAVGDAADYVVAKRNKEEALIEAYSSVDKDDLEKLSKIFKPDCELFGYDCRPDKIFKQTDQIKPWYFDISTA